MGSPPHHPSRDFPIKTPSAESSSHLFPHTPSGLGSAAFRDKVGVYLLLQPSTLAWKIPWMEEPGGLQSMGSLRVGHD